MKKRILSVLLVLAMALSLVPMGVFAVPGDEGEGGDKVTVTFKIENGTWKDDKIEDKVVKVNKGDKIPDNQLKELEGAKPNTGYGNGSWDKEIPTKDDAIDASATYTYTFSDIRPAAPSGLEPESPTIKGGNDGKITGTTNKMEYSTPENFESQKDCTATETTGLAAGTYYVRVKAAGETPAGVSAEIKVLDGPGVDGISLEKSGHKTTYKVGEEFDGTGLSIKAYLDNGDELDDIPVTADMVTGFDPSAPEASQRLTVTYGGKTAIFTIEVIKADGPAAPTGLWGVDPTTAGGSDGKIKGITEDMEYSANTNFNPAQRCSGTEIKNLQPGTYYVRVAGTDTKEPSEATTVVVPTFGNGVTKIEVNSTNHKTAYLVGDELDVTGLTILVTKSNNSTETVDVTADMVTGFNSSAAAQNKVLTVTYWGEKTTYKINITVPTKATVTFKVVNGTWSDGTTADQVVTIDLTNGKGKLDASKVPTGMKPNVGYKNIGTWDTVPDTDSDKVTRDVTYTCTFTKKENVAVVTFKVVNGKWKDNTTAPKQEEITLTNGKGTLDTSKVPTEMKANEGYENGAWDKAPVTTENGITEDVTYTYTFAAKETVAVVTFQIVNGTWSDKKTAPITKEITLVNGKGTLSAADVPTGMIANEGYGEGNWNTDLSKGVEITGNVTYTYGYNLLKATVTFKVVNGTWKDGSIKDITVTVDLKDGKG
ncbi:MAG: bacterial Ig-like domain-containing protein, partial [Ruminiclostridium sp.]|nr:bacterial Ig-like domain-containing protein [Ruminiclostridium sp.]